MVERGWYTYFCLGRRIKKAAKKIKNKAPLKTTAAPMDEPDEVVEESLLIVKCIDRLSNTNSIQYSLVL
jgi:hypothetical protein